MLTRPLKLLFSQQTGCCVLRYQSQFGHIGYCMRRRYQLAPLPVPTAEMGEQFVPTLVPAGTDKPSRDNMVSTSLPLPHCCTELQHWTGPVLHWLPPLGVPEGEPRLAPKKHEDKHYICTRHVQNSPKDGVPRLAGPLGGRPRAMRWALVSAETTVAAAARAKTYVNFIVF
jgi:hypothetical protein